MQEIIHFRNDYIKVNVKKAIDIDNITRFQKILCSILNRFYDYYQSYQILYKQFFPFINFKPLLKQKEDNDEEEDLTNFATKYK